MNHIKINNIKNHTVYNNNKYINKTNEYINIEEFRILCDVLYGNNMSFNNENKTSVESHYVASADILGMRPSDFPDNKNPISGRPSTEFFTNLNIQQTDDIFLKDPIILLYFILLIILAIYIFYRLFYVSRNHS